MTRVNSFSDYAFVSIGANLPSAVGDPEETIRYAFASLAGITPETLLMSSVYATSPVDSPAGTPDFLNAVAGLIPAGTETPQSLLEKLQSLEAEAGRTRSGTRNEARTLDLDLITFRNEIMNTPELILPHPRAHERRFVLVPLMEITGDDFIVPGWNQSVGEYAIAVPDAQEIRKK